MSLESVSSAHEITVDEFVSGKVTPLSIEDRVYEWTEKLVECLQANYDGQSSSLSTKFEIRRGRKFLKIVMINNQESVHAFIDKKTGEVKNNNGFSTLEISKHDAHTNGKRNTISLHNQATLQHQKTLENIKDTIAKCKSTFFSFIL